MAAILIVEDDLTFATMLKTWLGKQGFQISTAGDLSKAHKFLEHRSYMTLITIGPGYQATACLCLTGCKNTASLFL